MRSFEEPIEINKKISLEEIKQRLLDSDYHFFENEVMSEKYRSKICIGIGHNYVVLYPLKGCRKEFIKEIKDKIKEV